MNIHTQQQLDNTKAKLREAEERYRLRQQEPVANALVQELTLRSFKQIIDQLKEEIARYECQVVAPIVAGQLYFRCASRTWTNPLPLRSISPWLPRFRGPFLLIRDPP